MLKYFKEASDELLLLALKLKRYLRILLYHLSVYLSFLYKKLGIEEIVFFFRFLFHRYSPKQFNPIHVRHNLHLLFRKNAHDWITTNKEGKFSLLLGRKEKWLFSMKNILLFGALQKRVEKAVLFTYLTLTLELNNPFDKRLLTLFLTKKLALMERLLNYVQSINDKPFDQSHIRRHIRVFHRNSLLQARIIRSMELAIKRQKETEMIKEAKAALIKGVYPVLITQGVSGSYWMRDTARKVIGLFKPFDEEIHAPNNPVGAKFQGSLGLRKTRIGCRVGEAAHHEVGAYLVDEFFGFGIVPRTYYAAFTHRVFFLTKEDRMTSSWATKTKLGSFQEFVSGFISLDKLSKEEYQSIPQDEFQLLVVLDVIIGNTDRHAGNMLLGDEKLAAIDHGLSFTDRVEELCFWYWSYFEQGKHPLFPSLLDLVNHFPFEALAYKLKTKCFISLNALNRMRERIALFAEALNAGLVPAQLGDLFTPTYLYPLKDRISTLKETAAEQVRLFQTTL